MQRRTGSQWPNSRPNDDVTELSRHLEVVLKDVVFPSQSDFLPDLDQQLSFLLPLFSTSRRARIRHTRALILEIYALPFPFPVPARGSPLHTPKEPHDIRKTDLEERPNDLVCDRIGIHLILQPSSINDCRDVPNVLLPDPCVKGIFRSFGRLVQPGLSAELCVDKSHDLLPKRHVDECGEH